MIVPSIGSSPRLRGTVPRPQLVLDIDRFIPAPAGNSATPSTDSRYRSVHPRACGEQCHALQLVLDIGRFIPAPAGNSATPSTGSRYRSVHPRACGEQCHALNWFSISVGSSPRLRGTVSDSSIDAKSNMRFIPAPAGNSLTVMSMMWFDLQVAMISTSFRLG